MQSETHAPVQTLSPWPEEGESQRFWKLGLLRASRKRWSVCQQAEASVQHLSHLPTLLQDWSRAEPRGATAEPQENMIKEEARLGC